MSADISTNRPWFADSFIDLAQPRLGAEVLEVSDDFFAAAERLIAATEPRFIDDLYDDHGKWMDGWESRRRREGGHDWCVVRICPGVIEGVDIDTRHFTGNYPPRASIEACRSDGPPGTDAQWTEILPVCDLKGDSHNFHLIVDDQRWTHLRLNIFPDGGVARLRVYGVAEPDRSSWAGRDDIDLLAMANGGRALGCSDMHYGHMSNLLAPGEGVNMGDGWETRRRRGEGFDWVILKLSAKGKIHKIELDTKYFKGNFPHSFSLHGADFQDREDSDISESDADWSPLVEHYQLGPDQVHLLALDPDTQSPASHVRLDIHPDGGVSRLRLYGKIVD